MRIKDTINFGGYEWIILDMQDNKALVITKEMVAQRPYHHVRGAVCWANSEIRDYLNDEFLNTFNRAERDRMITVTNYNPDNHWYGTKGGEDTTDTIFLLSMEEIVCKYFGDSSDLLYHPGKNQRYWFQRKDENNGKRTATYQGYRWWWWTRTPGRTNNRAVYIWGDGNIGIQGNGTFHYSSQDVHPITEDNSGGVRPALWLRLT